LQIDLPPQLAVYHLTTGNDCIELRIVMIPQTRRLIPVVAASFLVAFVHPLPALPDINFDKSKSLGTWQQFVTSLGLQNDRAATIYFDTDKLVAGRFTGKGQYDFGGGNRQPLRTPVGRIVKQAIGPDIVVYDFDEIYTTNLPWRIIIFGRLPAAIVADGQISNWPSEDLSSATLDIHALNSFNPDDTTQRAPAGRGQGKDGNLREVIVLDGYGWMVSSGGGGGYGTAGLKGLSAYGPDGSVEPALLGGDGGERCLNWNVLRPGSPGGGTFDTNTMRLIGGGPGGGAIYVKSGGRLDLFSISASGGLGSLEARPLVPWRGIFLERNGGGSGGHIVLESPEAPSIYVAASILPGYRGGAGALEFRGIPSAPRVGQIKGIDGWTDSERAPVRMPRGISFGTDFKIFSGPRLVAPKVTASVNRLATSNGFFRVTASGTARNNLSTIRYRVRQPDGQFFGPWRTEHLADNNKRKSWSKQIASPLQGKYQVEVVAEDIDGRRSTGKVVEVVVDRVKPRCLLLEDAQNVIGRPGAYKINVLIIDDDGEVVVDDVSGPVRVEYQLKRPGAKTFGKKWMSLPVGGTTLLPRYVDFDLTVTINPAIRGVWEMQVRAVDAAGNVGQPRTTTITQ